jgi:hypothetical protein
MYDISNSRKISNEIEMSQELKKREWSTVQRFTTHHVYYDIYKKMIGITVFHPELGACECAHYLLD